MKPRIRRIWKAAAISGLGACAFAVSARAGEVQATPPVAAPEPVTPPSLVAPTPPAPVTPPASISPAASAAPIPLSIPEKVAVPSDRFREWGPTLSANVPHPVWIDLNYRPNLKFSFAFGFGGLAIPYKTSTGPSGKLSIGAADLRARWHPWGGAFFLGAALGSQNVKGTGSETIPVTIGSGPSTQTLNVETTLDAKIASTYLTPHLGWFWALRSGFVIGVDLGIQLPVHPQTTLDVTTNNRTANIAVAVVQATQQYQDFETKLKDTGNKVGAIPLPCVTVLRIGYLF